MTILLWGGFKTSTGTNKMRKTDALYLKTQRLIAQTHRYTKRDTQRHRQTQTDAHRETHTKRQTHTHKETHTKTCFCGLPFLLPHT